MPIDLLTLGAALLSGVIGSMHCIAMCGGIATSLHGFGTTRGEPGRALAAASVLNLGRVLGYALAGAVVGLLGIGLQQLTSVLAWQNVLRVALGILLMLIALRTFGIGDRWTFLGRIGAPIWQRLAPLRSRVLPANTWPRRLVLGMLWGWLPCGLSSSMLLVAWLEASPLHGALVMTAFGTGTLLTMIPLTWSGERVALLFAKRPARIGIATLIFCAGLLTALAPWLVHVPALHDALAALGCRSIQ